MNEKKIYVVQFVGVTEEQWFENHFDTSPLIRSKKSYHLHAIIFMARDAEAAYELASELVDGDSDCNHDGEGDLTRFYNLGIHDIQHLDRSVGELTEEMQRDYGYELPVFVLCDVDANGIPLVRAKSDLSIFRSQ